MGISTLGVEFWPRYGLEKVRNRYILLPVFGLTPRRRGSPGTISIKFLSKGHRWRRYTKWRRNIAENFDSLSRVHQRYRRQTTDRQTDGRWHIANVNVSQFERTVNGL